MCEMEGGEVQTKCESGMRWGDLQGPKYRELFFVQPTTVKYLAIPE